MKKNYFLLLLFIASNFAGFGQTWEKLFSKKGEDAFRSIIQVTGGGYVAAGVTNDSTANKNDAFLVRLDLDGDTIWTYSYNGTGNQNEIFYKVIETTDGGYLACGHTNSVNGTDDILYVKVNSAGIEQWAKTYGGTGKDRSQDLLETTDGFTICGYSTSSPAQYYDALLIHTDLNGDITWTKLYGQSNYDDANCIEQMNDGGYILGGQSNNGANGLDQFLIRTDVNGDTLWTKRFGTTGTDNIESMTRTQAGDGFVFCGSTNSANNSDDGYIVKIDTVGAVQWTKIYGDTLPDDFHDIETNFDGGYTLAGTTSSFRDTVPYMWLMRTNSQGDSLCNRIFGGFRHDHGYGAFQTADGGFIIAGYAGSFGRDRNEDGYIVKTDGACNVSDSLTFIKVYTIGSSFCSGTSTQLSVELWNFGNIPVSNIPVTVELTGDINMTLDTVITSSLNDLDFFNVVFPPFNSTGASNVTVNAFASVANDVIPLNNSFTATLTLSPCPGVEEIFTNLGLTLYPNPVNNYLVIDFYEQYSNAKIEFINSQGAIISSVSLLNTLGLKKTIDLSHLARGFYMVKISTPVGIDVRKVILN